MENLYWVGVRESEIEFCKEFFTNSITIFGNTNISMQQKLNKVIDHNNVKNFELIDEFFNGETKKLVEENPNTRFMYYSQINSYDSVKKIGLLDNVICLNNQNLVNHISDKFELKRLFKNIVPVLDYEILSGEYCKYDYLNKKFNTSDGSFVIQSSTGSGGSGTLVLNNKNELSLDISKKQNYMVTRYCEDNIPINIHVLISNNKILLLPGSVQIIQNINNKLAYKGCDYIAYNNINNKLIGKIEEYAYKIAEKLRQKGYMGLCGIDSIIYNDEIYLMEVNTRFQNSSTVLNLALKDNKLPSLQELSISCFSNEDITLKKFDVNYSCYIKEKNTRIDEIGLEPIIKLDNINSNVDVEEYSYTGSLIYDKSIINFISQ